MVLLSGDLDRTAHNYQKTGDLITLYTEATLIDQPYASKNYKRQSFWRIHMDRVQ